MSLDDRLRRGLPRLAAETDPNVEPALQRVVSGGRRRKMMYRAGAAAVVVALGVGAWIVTPKVVEAFRGEARPGSQGTDEETRETKTSAKSGWGIAGPLTCYEEGFTNEDLTFSPGYLPDGFSAEARPGPAPGAPPAEDGQVVVHWTDGERYFEARNPGTLFVELAQEDDAPTITVLGRKTADFGPVVPMEEDYIVQFTMAANGGPPSCSLWSLNEYGLSLEELKRVAEGLVPA
jgi:hypothetical protein